MELDKVEFIPGVITDVDDPEKLGRVKCAAVGLFDERAMDKDVLPWVMPMNMGRYQINIMKMNFCIFQCLIILILPKI